MDKSNSKYLWFANQVINILQYMILLTSCNVGTDYLYMAQIHVSFFKESNIFFKESIINSCFLFPKIYIMSSSFVCRDMDSATKALSASLSACSYQPLNPLAMPAKQELPMLSQMLLQLS